MRGSVNVSTHVAAGGGVHFMQLLFAVLILGAYLGAPTFLIWGWVMWIGHPEERNRSTVISFAGLLLATASGLLAVSAVTYSVWTGGYRYYDPRLLRIFRWGLSLSLTGVVLSALDTGRRNLIRWHALCSSIGTLLFWLVAIEAE